MRPQCGLRAELTEDAVEAARKSPVSRTDQKTIIRWMVVFSYILRAGVFSKPALSYNDLI